VTDFKAELISQLEKVKNKIIIITGYVTVEGFDFVEKYLEGKTLEKVIIFKLNLMDFKNGASSFNFKTSVQNGWKVYINKTIHAKNYIFDDEIIILGSSNLTSNGIGLIHNRKDDNNVIRNYSNDLKSWVERAVDSSVLITLEKADEIDNFVLKSMSQNDIQQINLWQKMLENRLVKDRKFCSFSKKVNNEDKLFLEKAIRSFIETFKSNPNNFTETISKDDFIRQYKYKENLEWFNNYIININQELKHEVFNCDNKLYKYTPRIYTNDHCYFVEKIHGSTLDVDNSDNMKTLLFALNEMFKIGIATNNCFSGVLTNRGNIKFKDFFPAKAMDKTELESKYKSSLLEKCNEAKIKALISDFNLQEGQNGVN